MGKQDVNDAYRKRQADITGLLMLIGQAVERHAEAIDDGSMDWAHVGDLGHVHQCLSEVLTFLSNKSQVTVERLLAERRQKESRHAAPGSN